MAAPSACPERPGSLTRHREFTRIAGSGLESLGGGPVLAEVLRVPSGVSEAVRALGGVSESVLRVPSGVSEAVRALGGVSESVLRVPSGVSEAVRALGGVSESVLRVPSGVSEAVRALGGVSESVLRAPPEGLSSVARFTSYKLTENGRRTTASLIDPASQDATGDTSPYERTSYAVKPSGQRNDLSGLATPSFADIREWPVLILLVPLVPVFANSGADNITFILQQYLFTFRMLGAVAEAEPAITGLSLVITVAGMMMWLLGRADRQ